jgi:hypothetical protein
LPTSKEEQEKVVDITENGTTEVAPDENKTLSKVTVNVGIGQSGDLPDWDDDSPIIANGKAYYSTKNLEWELTEKGTFRWKFIEGVAGNNRAEIFTSNSINNLSASYKKIAHKIKQVYFPDGVIKAEVVYATNCERIRFPDTLTQRHTIAGLTSLKEVDLSSELYTTIPDYYCSRMAELEKVQICPRTTILPRNSFEYCYSLKEINLENITNFAQACLDNDFSLTGAIVFNAGLTQIAATAFRATNITSITFQNPTDNLPMIANNSFQQCNGLLDIYVPWAEGAVANAPWGATNATIHYNTTFDENGNPIAAEV